MFLKKLFKFFTNSYLLIGYVFVAWMFLFDSEDIISQYRMRKKLRKLEDEYIFYTQKIQEIEKNGKEFLHNNELLEKFARERYYMKKDKEDVYVLVK